MTADGQLQEPKLNQVELDTKLAEARMIIGMCWPFLAPATYRLATRWVDDPNLPTMAVDGYWRLYLRRAFVTTLNPETLALLIVGHELQHALGEHSTRLCEYRGKYLSDGVNNIDFANACHDLAINSGLEETKNSGRTYRTNMGANAPDFKIPDGILHPHQFRDKSGNAFPIGLMSEDYAELFEKNFDEKKTQAAGKGSKGQLHKCGSGGGQEPGSWEDPSPADPGDAKTGVSKQEQELIRQATAQAAIEQESRSQGSVPGNLQRWAKIRIEPAKVDWRTQLRRVVRNGINWVSGRVEYTYSRPNRRGVASGSDIILPGLHAPKPKFVSVIDTSGSMGEGDFQKAFSELRGILKACGFHRMPVIPCDAAVSDVQYVTRIEDIKLVGGGGTDMSAGIRAAVDLGFKLVIVLSDGETGWPEAIPGVKVIAVLTRKRSAQPPAWISTVRVA